MALQIPKEIKYIQHPQEVSDKIMQYFVKSDFDKGLRIAKEYWVLSDREIDRLETQIERQWRTINKRFGLSLDMEFIKTQKLGDSFIRYYYLQKFENHAIYWSFTFYRSKGMWQINEIIFKDDLDSLFE
jgi:hypothetical protein